MPPPPKQRSPCASRIHRCGPTTSKRDGRQLTSDRPNLSAKYPAVVPMVCTPRLVMSTNTRIRKPRTVPTDGWLTAATQGCNRNDGVQATQPHTEVPTTPWPVMSISPHTLKPRAAPADGWLAAATQGCNRNDGAQATQPHAEVPTTPWLVMSISSHILKPQAAPADGWPAALTQRCRRNNGVQATQPHAGVPRTPRTQGVQAQVAHKPA
jgi:hypothetical protein